MPITNDITGAIILLTAFVTIIGGTEMWTRRRRPDPELSRKVVHVASGAVCLLFPIFVESLVSVLILAILFVIFLFVATRFRALACLNSVDRRSHGSEFYPLAVFFLFFVSRDRWWLYFTALLILAVSDAAAALIGSRFGKHRYRVGKQDVKSLEGSIAFFGITYFVIAGLLNISGEVPTASALFIAFLVGMLLMGAEAISVHGTDNIFVPVLTCYVLLKITEKPLSEVIYQCISLVAILALLLVFTQALRILSIRDSIVLILFAYACWSLGSVNWALPVFAGFGFYCLIRLMLRVRAKHEHTVMTRSLISVILAPLFLLLVANWWHLYDILYGVFLQAAVAAASCSAWICVLHSDDRQLDHRYMKLGGLCLGGAVVIAGLCTLSVHHAPLHGVWIMGLLSLICVASYDLYLQSCARANPAVIEVRPVSILVVCTFAAAAYFLLQSHGALQTWELSNEIYR